MTKAESLKVARKLVMLTLLISCFWVVTATDATPTTNAQASCCDCEYLLQNCLQVCNGGGTAYGCSTDCENCCRWEAIYIPHCFATCSSYNGYCQSNEDCLTGDQCLNNQCVCS
jgi:hypothetical protein